MTLKDIIAKHKPKNVDEIRFIGDVYCCPHDYDYREILKNYKTDKPEICDDMACITCWNRPAVLQKRGFTKADMYAELERLKSLPTLKDIVVSAASSKPALLDDIGDFYYGGVLGCPEDYYELDDYHTKPPKGCVYATDATDKDELCTKCWNRPAVKKEVCV